MIQLECHTCNQSFLKEDKEYRRHVKRGRKDFFCSLRCFGFWKCQKRPFAPPTPRKPNELSPFRLFINNVHSRKTKKYCDITPESLKEIWEQQNGICPFTGWKLRLPRCSNDRGEFSMYNASLDRIDNNRGYTKDNVRFVSLMANYARNRFTDHDMIEFCKSVSSHQ